MSEHNVRTGTVLIENLELRKTGDRIWNYEVYLDGNKQEGVTKLELILEAGCLPQCKLSYDLNAAFKVSDK